MSQADEMPSDEQPLDVPRRTLAAIDQAHLAAGRARRAVEIERADTLAGFALVATGLGGMACSAQGFFGLGAEAAWAVQIPALALLWIGVFLVYRAIWRMVRGRTDCAVSRAEKPGSRGRRAMLITLGCAWLSVIVMGLLIQTTRSLLGDNVYFAILIGNLFLCVGAAIAFFVYRFARTGLWELLAFAAAVAGTAGMYLAMPYVLYQISGVIPAGVVLASLGLATAASVSLLVRRRRLVHADAAKRSDPGHSVEGLV
jgi:hypothetical protein